MLCCRAASEEGARLVGFGELRHHLVAHGVAAKLLALDGMRLSGARVACAWLFLVAGAQAPVLGGQQQVLADLVRVTAK